MSGVFSSNPAAGVGAGVAVTRSPHTGTSGADLRGARSRHQQLSSLDRAADRRRLSGRRRIFAHCPARRGAVADRAPQRAGDRAHAWRAPHLPRQDGGAQRHSRAHHRDRGVPLRRQRARIRRSGAGGTRRYARDCRPGDGSPSRCGRCRRSRRPRREVDRAVRHRRRIFGDHLARRRRARRPAPRAGLGLDAPRRGVARRKVRRRRRDRTDLLPT